MRSTSSERLKPWVTGCCCSWSSASVRLEPPGPAAATSSSQTRTGSSRSTISTPSSSASRPRRSRASRPKALGSRRGGIAAPPARGRAARAGFPCRCRRPHRGRMAPTSGCPCTPPCPSRPPFHSAGRSMNRRTDRPARRPPSSVLPPPDSSPRRSIHARPGPVSVAPRAPVRAAPRASSRNSSSVPCEHAPTGLR